MTNNNAKLCCSNIRKKILFSIYYARSGHVGPSLSAVELIYLILKLGINYKKKDRNKFILSKGHAAPAFYAVLDELNLLKKNELKSLRKVNSRLQGHPDKKKLNLVDTGSGALGQGLSIGIGYSLASKLLNTKNKIFCLLGDGEIQEGQIWEAAMYIGAHNLKNIITFIDGNKFQNERSIDETLPEKNLINKWKSFGFQTISIDGHSISSIEKVIKLFLKNKNKKPLLIYCNTIKGKGVSFMENNNKFHSVKDLSEEYYKKAILELS
jgi:transketolase